MKKVLKKTRTFRAGFMALMMIVTLLPMTVLADDPNQDPNNDPNQGQGNEQGGEQQQPEGNNDPVFNVDFGSAAWTIGGNNVSVVSFNGNNIEANHGAYQVNWNDQILLTGFDRDTMDIQVESSDANDNYTRILRSFPEENGVFSAKLSQYDGEGSHPGSLNFNVIEKTVNNNPGGDNPGGDNPGGNQIQNGNVLFDIINQHTAEVKYSIDNGTTWNYVDVDTSQEQFAQNVNFREANLNGVTSIKVKVVLNNDEFDAFRDENNIGNNNLHVIIGQDDDPNLSEYNIENSLKSDAGFSFNYENSQEKNYVVEIRFADGAPAQNFTYEVTFGEGTVNGNVVTYSVRDIDVTLTIEGAQIQDGKLTIDSRDAENVKFTLSGFQSNNMAIMSNGFRVTPPNGQNWFNAREFGSPNNDSTVYPVTLEITDDDPNNQPHEQETPTIKLIGNHDDIILMQDGKEVTKVDGITISFDNSGMPILTLASCNKEGDVLDITNCNHARLCVQGTNSFYGISLGEGVKLEVDIADFHQNDPNAEALGTLKIGNDAIRGEGQGSEINITGDVILDLSTNGDAFTGFEKVRLTNYEFHSREKTNNIIYAEGFGFKGVGRVEIYSTKAEFAVGKLTDEMIPVVVCQEGQIKVVGSPDEADFRSRYYESYPGDGGPADNIGQNLESADNMSEVSIFDNEMSTAARESFKFSDDGAIVLTSLDPILYSISYQVDKEYFEEHPELGDPYQGEVFMNGFKKGFWIKNGTGGKFEAWIAAGETVNVTILPKPGYQYIKNTLNINGATIDTEPGVDIGTYSFVSGPNAGHICAGFIKTDDVVEVDNSLGIKNAAVQAEDGVVESGNVKLTISKANPSEADMNKIKAAADVEDGKYVNLDLDVNEYVVKNYDPNATKQEAWESDLPGELAGKVTIGIEVPQDVDLNSRYEVVRLHNGKAERLDVTYLGEDKMIAFETDKFSTYSIVYTPLVILDGNNQEIDGSKDITIRSNGDFKEFVGLLMDRTTPVPENCYEKKEGSTIVILKHDYLETLSEGPHRLTFVYTDGEVSADFTLKKTSNTSGSSGSSSSGSGATLVPVKDSVPKTGENNTMLIVLMILSGASLLGMGYAVRSLRKKE